MDSSQYTANESKSKADQLSQQFYSKTAQILVQSRLQSENSNGKRNKWFNLELEDYEPLREELKFWKGQLLSTQQAPPLIVDIFLDISGLPNNQNLILTDSTTGRRHRIKGDDLVSINSNGLAQRKERILLETWQLTLAYSELT
jgi:hypothetical protein